MRTDAEMLKTAAAVFQYLREEIWEYFSIIIILYKLGWKYFSV